MAEKEDYIVISKKDFDYKKGHYVTHLAKQMTRTEAIERMAKALFKVDNVLALDIEFEQLKKQKQLAYKVFAEAALNALLEAK